MYSMGKRTFTQIRVKILKSLEEKPKSMTAIAREIGANWITIKRHLIWLEKVEGKVKLVKKNEREHIYKKI